MIDFFAGVVGQRQAVEQMRGAVTRPVHAYMFTGPSGAGKRNAALAFAAALLNDERAAHGTHPDVIVVEREGASISVAQAREISRVASRSPIEGDRKVLILTDFHLVDEAAPALLKTIEEATESTVFVILAESVTRELVTVASRCCRIEFSSLSVEVIELSLVESGIAEDRAHEAAVSAFGNLDRARLLATDDAVVARHELWLSILNRIDGTGAMAAGIAAEIIEAIDHASAALVVRQGEEAAAAEDSVKKGGQSNQVLKLMETRHKRELRRLRTDELNAGFATLMQKLVRRLVDANTPDRMRQVEASLSAVHWANEALTFNPNEGLLLQALLVRLGQSTAVVLV